MKTIVIIAQKGGVGKTTVFNEVAFSLERSGIPINTYDLDGQGGGAHGNSKTEGAEVTIVDTAGSLTDKIKSYIQASDLVIVPCCATGLDVKPLARIQDVVKQNLSDGAKVLFVVNRMNRWTTATEFIEWFNKRDFGYAVTLPESEQFRKAVSLHQSVIDVAPKASTAYQDTMKLVNTVRELIGIPKE